MKLIFAAVLLVVTIVGSASGQVGYIGIYSDPAYTDCDLVDVVPPGVQLIYIVHRGSSGATAVQFRVVPSSGASCVLLGEDSPYNAILGDAESGIYIGFGGCVPSDNLVMTLSYFCDGASTTCSSIDIEADPDASSGGIEITDCSLTPLVGTGARLIINGDSSCPCGAIPPVREKTWGAIKALYRSF